MEQNADLLFFFAKKPNALPLYEAFAQRVLAQVGAPLAEGGVHPLRHKFYAELFAERVADERY